MAAKSELDPTGPDPTKAVRIRAPWQIMAYLKQARVFRNHTTRQAAKLAGTAQPTYVGWENSGSMRGHPSAHSHLPQLPKLLALLDALEYDLILRPRNIPPPPAAAEIEDVPIPGVDARPCLNCGTQIDTGALCTACSNPTPTPPGRCSCPDGAAMPFPAEGVTRCMRCAGVIPAA